MSDAYEIARFWSQVDVRKRDQCWVWLGPIEQNYGNTKWEGRTERAHRVAFELFTGEALAEDAVLRHTCDLPRCCNPDHLVPGTHADNVNDRVLRKRSAAGVANGRARLSEAQVRKILSSTGSPDLLARTYGVSKDTIRAIRAAKTWKHVV